MWLPWVNQNNGRKTCCQEEQDKERQELHVVQWEEKPGAFNRDLDTEMEWSLFLTGKHFLENFLFDWVDAIRNSASSTNWFGDTLKYDFCSNASLDIKMATKVLLFNFNSWVNSDKYPML